MARQSHVMVTSKDKNDSVAQRQEYMHDEKKKREINIWACPNNWEVRHLVSKVASKKHWKTIIRVQPVCNLCQLLGYTYNTYRSALELCLTCGARNHWFEDCPRKKDA